MGAAAVAPFMGLIGRKPIIHDPLEGAQGATYRNLDELGNAARPGDILLTSKPSGSYIKTMLDPTGGSQFYHAQPVISRDPRNNKARTYQAGDFAFDGPDPGRAASDHASDIAEYMRSKEVGYPDGLLLRRKKKLTLTPKQLAAYHKDLDERALREYDNVHGMKGLFHDLFVPKIKALNKHVPDTICEGNVCSTMPAMAHHTATGERILDNVPAKYTMPADFLRAEDYELVGSHITPETRALQKSRLRKLAPYATRAGIGAGLAGTTYAVSEDPALGVAGGTALATNLAIDSAHEGRLHNLLPRALQKRLSPDTLYRHFPGTVQTINEVKDSTTRGQKARHIAKYLSGRAPLMLGAGALAYGGTKGLQRLLTESPDPT
jgi:hypothetical protein